MEDKVDSSLLFWGGSSQVRTSTRHRQRRSYKLERTVRCSAAAGGEWEGERGCGGNTHLELGVNAEAVELPVDVTHVGARHHLHAPGVWFMLVNASDQTHRGQQTRRRASDAGI